MKTLDYLHLNEKKVADVVSALHQLLADFQVHYTNLRGFHWDIKGHGFFVLHGKFEDMYNDAAEKVDETVSYTHLRAHETKAKRCMTTPLKRWTKSQNVS